MMDGALCGGHGKCGPDGVCQCRPGYKGEVCAQQVCPQDCNNHGVCVDFTCKCNPGYWGITCDFKKCANECEEHGTCNNGTCVCKAGWKGIACQVMECPKDCNGRGVCSDFKCSCDNPWTGDDCSLKVCGHIEPPPFPLPLLSLLGAVRRLFLLLSGVPCLVCPAVVTHPLPLPSSAPTTAAATASA
jgi:hypothetical protein